MNKRTLTVSAALPALLCLSFSLLCAPAGQAEENALVLKQWSFLNGATQLTLSKKGVRFEVPGRHLAMIMAPPVWNVQFLNLQRKVYYECTPAAWRPQMSSATVFFRPGDPGALVPASSAESTIQGLKCRRYLLKLPASQNSSGTHTWEQLLVKTAELYAIDDNNYPKVVKTILAKNFGTYRDAGIPLVLTCTNNRNEISKELRLSSHSTTPFKAGDFLVPKDFKRVKTGPEVTSNQSDNEGFSEFIR